MLTLREKITKEISRELAKSPYLREFIHTLQGEMTLREIDKHITLARLALYHGNITLTAKSLGLSRSGLQRKLARLK